MLKIEQSGVGAVETTPAIRDSKGKSMLPLQADVTDTVSFRVMGRVSPEGRWQEVRAAGSEDFLETVSWVSYLRLEVLSGTGSVVLFIGEE